MITENYPSQEKLSKMLPDQEYRRTFFDYHARLWMAGVLIITDITCMFVSIMLALQVRWFSVKYLTFEYEQIFFILTIILLIKFYRSGLYSSVGLHYVDELSKVANSLSSTFVIVLAVTFLLQTSLIYSRLVILLAWLISMILIPLGRYLVRRFLIRFGRWGVPVIIIGSTQKAKKLAEELQINLHHGLRPGLLVCDEFSTLDNVDRQQPVFSLERIKEYSRRLKLNDAVIIIDDLNNLDMVVDRYRFIFKRVILIKDQTGKYGLNHLQPLDFANMLGLQVNNNLLSTSAQLFKRLIDVIVSFLGLLVLSPFFCIVSILIKLDSPGDVFYRQARVGKHGKSFYLFKFRTMLTDADNILEKKLKEDATLKQEWDCYQKLKMDPRVTKIGKLLRKFSFDELPQLINILLGDMSLVGPRPIMLDQREIYGTSYKDYVQVTPGLTGLWQVSGRNQTSFARRAELDNEYIQRWSVWMDTYILLKTIKVVLWRDGAY